MFDPQPVRVGSRIQSQYDAVNWRPFLGVNRPEFHSQCGFTAGRRLRGFNSTCQLLAISPDYSPVPSRYNAKYLFEKKSGEKPGLIGTSWYFTDYSVWMP